MARFTRSRELIMAIFSFGDRPPSGLTSHVSLHLPPHLLSELRQVYPASSLLSTDSTQMSRIVLLSGLAFLPSAKASPSKLRDVQLLVISPSPDLSTAESSTALPAALFSPNSAPFAPTTWCKRPTSPSSSAPRRNPPTWYGNPSEKRIGAGNLLPLSHGSLFEWYAHPPRIQRSVPKGPNWSMQP